MIEPLYLFNRYSYRLLLGSHHVSFLVYPLQKMLSITLRVLPLFYLRTWSSMNHIDFFNTHQRSHERTAHSSSWLFIFGCKISAYHHWHTILKIKEKRTKETNQTIKFKTNNEILGHLILCKINNVHFNFHKCY